MKKIAFLLVALADLLLVMTNLAYAETAPQTTGSFSPYATAVLKMNSEQVRPTTAFLQMVNADSTSNQEETDAFTNKMGIGILNTATFWTDIPRQIKAETEKSNVLVGATVGFGKGLVKGAERGAAGIYDVTTCTFTPYDEPSMKPAYTVKDPDRGLKVNLMSW